MPVCCTGTPLQPTAKMCSHAVTLLPLPGCFAETPSPDGSKERGGRRIVWDRTPLAEGAHKQPAHMPASAPALQVQGLELAGTDEFLALESAAEADGDAGELTVQDPTCAEGAAEEGQGAVQVHMPSSAPCL